VDCLSSLQDEGWRPSITVKQLLLGIQVRRGSLDIQGYRYWDRIFVSVWYRQAPVRCCGHSLVEPWSMVQEFNGTGITNDPDDCQAC
jgi:hypothetical protein